MHSPKFEQVKYWYEAGLWSEARVRNAVGRWITAAEYAAVTGAAYEEAGA